MPDFHQDEERREERAESFLIVGSALLMLCGLALLVAAVLIARQERPDRSNASAPPVEGSPGIGKRSPRAIEPQPDRRDFPVNGRR